MFYFKWKTETDTIIFEDKDEQIFLKEFIEWIIGLTSVRSTANCGLNKIISFSEFRGINGSECQWDPGLYHLLFQDPKKLFSLLVSMSSV